MREIGWIKKDAPVPVVVSGSRADANAVNAMNLRMQTQDEDDDDFGTEPVQSARNSQPLKPKPQKASATRPVASFSSALPGLQPGKGGPSALSQKAKVSAPSNPKPSGTAKETSGSPHRGTRGGGRGGGQGHRGGRGGTGGHSSVSRGSRGGYRGPSQ